MILYVVIGLVMGAIGYTLGKLSLPNHYAFSRDVTESDGKTITWPGGYRTRGGGEAYTVVASGGGGSGGFHEPSYVFRRGCGFTVGQREFRSYLPYFEPDREVRYDKKYYLGFMVVC